MLFGVVKAEADEADEADEAKDADEADEEVDGMSITGEVKLCLCRGIRVRE
jgi:hypothetical protein